MTNEEIALKAAQEAKSSRWWVRSVYYMRYHHYRFVRHVEANGLLCQDCGGLGGETIPILDDGTGPYEECGWCEGTGKMTPWARGQWLTYKRFSKAKGKKP